MHGDVVGNELAFLHDLNVCADAFLDTLEWQVIPLAGVNTQISLDLRPKVIVLWCTGQIPLKRDFASLGITKDGRRITMSAYDNGLRIVFISQKRLCISPLYCASSCGKERGLLSRAMSLVMTLHAFNKRE